MYFTLEKLTRRQQSINHVLNCVEQSLLDERYSNAESWKLLHRQLTDIQYNPNLGLPRYKDKLLAPIKGRYVISDRLLTAFEKDHERLDALGNIARGSIRTLLQRPGAVNTSSVYSDVFSIIHAYRQHMRLESELIFPMIGLVLAVDTQNSLMTHIHINDTDLLSINLQHTTLH